jgi:hypothetical protein
MEENQGYPATLGTCSADPYLCSLAASYTSANNWSGVTHPSVNNYLGLFSGATYGSASPSINDSCTPSATACSTNASNLGQQLTAKGIPWVSEQESMPSACYLTYSSGAYVDRHDPVKYFNGIRENTAYCKAVDVPYPGSSAFVSQLDGSSAPDFVFVTPNVNDDMHDGSVAAGDAWLKTNLAPVLASRWFTGGNATVIVTMDENTGDNSGAGGGHVPMVIISSNAKGKGPVSITGNHYGTLRSIEGAYGLPLLGAAASAANGDLSGLFG